MKDANNNSSSMAPNRKKDTKHISQMATTFPLLTALQGQIPEEPEELDEEEKAKLVSEIRKFGREPAERAYGLIRAYSINSGDASVITLPFAGSALKSGPKFELEKLPLELQHILRKFVELHLETHAN